MNLMTPLPEAPAIDLIFIDKILLLQGRDFYIKFNVSLCLKFSHKFNNWRNVPK